MSYRKVLKSRPLSNYPGLLEAEIVLCHLPDNTDTPYVTWQRNVIDKSTYWGHYYHTLAAAEQDFNTRGRS